MNFHQTCRYIYRLYGTMQKDDWQKAHSLIDSLDDKNSCWVHAYLHRKEGDISNADYWYRRAQKQRPAVSLQEEWKLLLWNCCLNSKTKQLFLCFNTVY